MEARLFARLHDHFRRRDRLRLVIRYRRKYLEVLVRQGEDEAGKIEQEYRQASARNEQEYAETAAAMTEKNWNRLHRDHHARSMGSLHRGAMSRR